MNRKPKEKSSRRSGKTAATLISVLKLLYGTAALTVFLFLAIVAYLTVFGVPRSLLDDRLTEFNQREQIGLSVGSVRYYPPDTLRIEDLRMEGARLDESPLFQCEDCWVKLDLGALSDPKSMLERVYIEDGSASLRIYENPPAETDMDRLDFSGIDARIDISEDGWRLVSSSCRLGAVRIAATGVYHKRRKDGARRKELREYIHTGLLSEQLKQKGVAEKILRWQREYDDLEFPQGAEAQLDFEFFSTDKERRRIDVEMSSERLSLRGLRIDEFELAAAQVGRRIIFDSVRFLIGDDCVNAKGEYDMNTKLVAVDMTSNLDAASVKLLLPASFSSRMAALNLDLNGALEFGCRLGPARAADLGEIFDADFSATAANYRDLSFKSVSANVRRRNRDVEISDMDLAAENGSVSGSGGYNLESGEYSGGGRARLDPDILLPMVKGRKLREVIQSLEIGDDLVKFEGECSGIVGKKDELAVDGMLEGRNFDYAAHSFDRFSCRLSVSNRVLGFDSFELLRPEGRASGDLSIDLERKEVELDILSGCSYDAILGIIDEDLPGRFDWMQFSGPLQVAASGHVNYGLRELSDMRGTVSARDVTLKGVPFEQLEFKARMQAGVLDIGDISAQACDGVLQGDFSVDLPPSSDAGRSNNNYDYTLSIDIDDADFADMVAVLKEAFLDREESEKDDEIYEGVVDLQVDMKGASSNGVNVVRSGEYTVEINKGRLFQIPLLGGLSKYLSKLIPRFGYLSQTELVASGLVRPDRILIHEVELRGDVITVKGHGDYYYDHSLDVDVQVLLLRKGVVASLLRIITFPVTKLFEFTLTGTLEEPAWHLKNIPKELFLKFD